MISPPEQEGPGSPGRLTALPGLDVLSYSPILKFEPVAAILLARPVLRLRLTTYQVSGVVLVVIAVLFLGLRLRVTSWARWRARRSAADRLPGQALQGPPRLTLDSGAQ